MDKETINRTFESAATVICQQWLDKEFNSDELFKRMERARALCIQEFRKHLGLDIDPVMVNK